MRGGHTLGLAPIILVRWGRRPFQSLLQDHFLEALRHMFLQAPLRTWNAILTVCHPSAKQRSFQTLA